MNHSDTDGHPGHRLDRCRREIERIDDRILELISRRQEEAFAIGATKAALHMEVYDPAREEAVLGRLLPRCGGHLPESAVSGIYREIFSAARSVQEPLRVAFLGPEGTFSHEAAGDLFGESAEYTATRSIEEVFANVEKGVCRHGVAPVENSHEGSVADTLDLLYRYELKICAEKALRIRHHLLSTSERIEEVKRLYSHPMALSQCREWIRLHLPGVRLVETASTAGAAETAAHTRGSAALGSRMCASRYRLGILNAHVEDHPGNITRFAVLGRTDAEPTGTDKTSLLFSLRHRPGALHDALSPLSRRGINMNRIESRPMKGRNWEYLFFSDLEGHAREPAVAEAIREMKDACAFIKVLGAYPADRNLAGHTPEPRRAGTHERRNMP